MKKIAIIDYGMGNIQSVANALEFLGYSAIISDKQEILQQCDAYILPGVGAFYEAMHNLTQRNLITFLTTEVIEKHKPLLGICLGMQLLMESSQEMGFHTGLGWIKGEVIAIPADDSIRTPHVGWNNLYTTKTAQLFTDLGEDGHFYFDHSFYVQCDKQYISAYCEYGPLHLTAALQKDHIFATQFHPEKSQTKGLKLLRNYLNFVEETSC
jgi:glutamine amidotransferase